MRCVTLKWRPNNAPKWVKRWTITQVFANLTVLTLEEVSISLCRSSRVIPFCFDAILTDRCICYLTVAMLVPHEGNQNGVSIQSSSR